MSDRACVFRLMHMLLDDEASAKRIVGHLCDTWLLHHDDIGMCMQTFFDDVFFAPIQLTLTKENISIWPAVNALLTLQNTSIFSVDQMGMVRDVPKNAGSFFVLRVGVVADTPMWTSCTLNKDLDESTGSRFYLLKAFVSALVQQVNTFSNNERMLHCMLSQLRAALLSSVSSALHIHSCHNNERVALLQSMQRNLQACTDLGIHNVVDLWLGTVAHPSQLRTQNVRT